MRRVLAFLILGFAAAVGVAQDVDSEPVFGARLVADRTPVVAGAELRLAVVLDVKRGWHVNSDRPGDEFSVPTTVTWALPEGWPQVDTTYPPGRAVRFEFAEQPVMVWDGRVVMVGRLAVPEGARGETALRAEVIAQACNDRQCLPPRPVGCQVTVSVAAPGTPTTSVEPALFAASAPGPVEPGASRFAGMPLPLLLGLVLLAGLGLNLTPCVYPLIPITISIFAREAKERAGGTFGLAVAYVLGMAVTYSTLGVIASLTGRLFGSALQHPVVISVVVVVLLALAASMFGFWELRPPAWALRASGGRAGYLGALIMGLIVGFVAAPASVRSWSACSPSSARRATRCSVSWSSSPSPWGSASRISCSGCSPAGSSACRPRAAGWRGSARSFGVMLIALAAFFASPLAAGRNRRHARSAWS